MFYPLVETDGIFRRAQFSIVVPTDYLGFRKKGGTDLCLHSANTHIPSYSQVNLGADNQCYYERGENGATLGAQVIVNAS